LSNTLNAILVTGYTLTSFNKIIQEAGKKKKNKEKIEKYTQDLLESVDYMIGVRVNGTFKERLLQELGIKFEDDENEKVINTPPFNSSSKTSTTSEIIISEEFAKIFETPKIIETPRIIETPKIITEETEEDNFGGFSDQEQE
jgi:hypothetical protein